MPSGFDLTLPGRAVLAAVLGFVLGWERERCGSPAGDRTYALVALGASVVTTVGTGLFPESAGRVIAGVITGIGFLGAGVIVREGTGSVRGLTTAVGLWAVSVIGVVVGLGHYVAGVILAAVVLLILMWEEVPWLSRIGYRKPRAGEHAAPARPR